MDWLKNLLQKYHLGWLAGIAGMLSITFIANLFIALSDGKIDPSEFHSLSTSANGVELFVLLLIMAALKKN